MTAPPTPCRCGATFDPTSADSIRRHRFLYNHTPVERKKEGRSRW